MLSGMLIAMFIALLLSLTLPTYGQYTGAKRLQRCWAIREQFPLPEFEIS